MTTDVPVCTDTRGTSIGSSNPTHLRGGNNAPRLFGVSSFAKGDQVSVDDEIAVPRRGIATGMNDRTSISQPLGVPREIGVDDRFRTCSLNGIRQTRGYGFIVRAVKSDFELDRRPIDLPEEQRHAGCDRQSHSFCSPSSA